MSMSSPYVARSSPTEGLHHLKGPRAPKVKMGILRYGNEAPLLHRHSRRHTPQERQCHLYDRQQRTGYIKIKNFGETTYPELLTSLAEVSLEGSRGSASTYAVTQVVTSSSAIQMVNEFLPKNRLIVYTQGQVVADRSPAVIGSDGRAVPTRISSSSCSSTRH